MMLRSGADGTAVSKLLQISYWQAVLRNPAAATGLAVDLAPIFAVVMWGWGAAPLLLLYWLENLVIGFATAGRMLMAAIGKHGPGGLFSAAFLIGFFTFHYGIFCLAHGGLLLEFLGAEEAMSGPDDIVAFIWQLVQTALTFGAHMDWILAMIAAWHAMMLAEYVWRGEWKGADPQHEMFAPYGRIVLLHMGVFVVGGALQFLGDPMIGVIALVVARALWGLHMNMRPRKPAASVAEPVGAEG